MKRILSIVVLSFMAQMYSQFGNGLAFDGADDIVDISSTIPTVTTTQDITVEAWVYPVTNAGTRIIASKYYSGSSPGANFMITRNPDQKLLISGNGTNVITTNGIIPLNTWTHIAVVFKAGTNNTKIYISGTLDISGTLNYNTINSTTNMRIGEFVNFAGQSYYTRWSGAIDEMRLWNTARTLEQISGNMGSPLTGSETGLVALYSFDQGVAGGSNPGVTTLTDFTGHNYSGALQNFALTGTISNWVTGYTVPVIPDAPVAVTATNVSNTSFTANWNAVSGATDYYLDVDDNNDFSSPLIGYNNLSVGNVLLKAVTGLTISTTYYYRLRAYNAAGTSGNSNTITSTTVYIEIPAAPVAVAATNVSYTSFTANWNASSGADGYYLDVDDNNDFSSPLTGYNNLSVGNVLLKAVAGLTLSTTYYYRLRAYNAAGTSGNSNSVSVLTPTQVIPGAPVAIAATNVSYTSFTANWDPTSGADGYYLDVDDNNDFSSPLTGYNNLSLGNVLLKAVTGLTMSTTYYYRLRAYNAGGSSGYSNTIEAQTLFMPFTEINTGLYNIRDGSVDWGDYDNDGDLDILLIGEGTSKIYNNDAGIFTDISANILGCYYSSAEWGDYDNDGDLDILMTGAGISKIYRNDSGIFSDINAGLISVVSQSGASWGDYDNDGDLDLFLSGWTGDWNTGIISKIYRNDSGIFTDINADIVGVSGSSVAWGDYDNDGDLDLLVTGNSNDDIDIDIDISEVYRNDSGKFENINAGLVGVSSGSVDWGDYDNDGDLDILLAGSYKSRIYRNDAGIFTSVTQLIGVRFSSSSFGDYDNDGDLDVLITGASGNDSNPISVTKLFNNNAGIFTDSNYSLTGVSFSDSGWGDYDNDGDLDFIIIGYNHENPYLTKLYRNDSIVKNTKPNAPSNLISQMGALSTLLSWDKATDAQTAQNGLSYNLYVGTASQTGNKKSPMSNIQTGYRKVVNLGNANQKNSYTIKNLPVGTYYWSVQAVDNAFAGSNFAVEKTFFQGAAVPSNVNVIVNGSNVTISWGAVAGATSFKIFTCDDPYGTFADISSEGVFDGTSWSYTNTSSKKFYYVIAVME